MLEINETQKKIVKKIHEQPGINSTEISEEIGIKPSSVSHNVTKLKQKNIVTDTKLGNNTSYELEEDVELGYKLQLAEALNWKVGTHAAQFAVTLFIMAYYLSQSFYILLGFALGFIPSFLYTLKQLFNDIGEIRVVKNGE